MNNARNTKRILILTSAFRPCVGGSEIAIEQLIRRLPNFYFDIVTPLYNKNHLAIENSELFSVHRTWPSGKLSKWLFIIFGFFKARQLMREHSYEAIHVWQASYAGGVAWLLKMFGLHIPIILTLQEGKKLHGQRNLIHFFRKIIIKKADIITAISNYLLVFAKETKKETPVFLIPNGIDQEIRNHISKQKIFFIKKELQIAQAQKILITVSRLVNKNSVDDIINAMQYLPENVRLLILGTGEQETKLKLMTQRFWVNRRVDFLGNIPNNEVPNYLAISDIFIRPSRSEGQGISFLEAMAVGVPIIGTAV